MKHVHIRLVTGILTATVLAGALCGYSVLSRSYSKNSMQVNAQSNSFAPPVLSSASLKPVSSALEKKDETIVLTEELQNSVIKNPDKLKSSLASPSAILVRVKDRKILFNKDAEGKIYPASMTKIMTAILAIEKLPNLAEKITLTQPIFDRMYRQDASMAGFLPGESVSAEDLLYGAILPSGAECCAALAERLAGTEAEFAVEMNQKAAQIGLSGTHFTNTTGLHDPNHYSTVKDIAALLCYAVQNETFCKIFTTPRYTTAATNKHPKGLSFQSTMFRCLKSAKVGKATILGGKVGFTDEAGLCLASLAEEEGTEYILVTAGVKDLYRGEIHDALETYGILGEQ